MPHLIKPQKSKLKNHAAASLCFSFFLSLFNTYTHGTPVSALDPVYMPINLYDIFKWEINCPAPGLHPVSLSGVSSLVARSLVCLWHSSVVRHQRYSSQCQSLNRKSHGEDLLINIDLITARQKMECVPFPLVAQVRNCLTSQNCLTDKTQLAEDEKWNGWGNNMQISQCAISNEHTAQMGQTYQPEIPSK